ncbi:MAG: hypothetical protein K6G79_09365 [Bacteroidales bacterium]|nr:hypothetical protein [Bacteroidales bacterium]
MSKLYRSFLVLSCLLLGAVTTGTATAQTRGFEFGVDAKGGIGVGKCRFVHGENQQGKVATAAYLAGADAFGGWRFNDYLFLGAGVGFRYSKALGMYYINDDRSPYSEKRYEEHIDFARMGQFGAFARGKANFTAGSCSPFVMGDIGYYFATKKYPDRMAGLFFEPAVGCDFRFAGMPVLSLSVGFHCQKTAYDSIYMLVENLDFINDRTVETVFAKLLTINLGITF